MEPEAAMLTTEDVANFLKVDVVTVRRLVSRGQLAAYRVGAEFRFTKSDVQGYLKRQYVPADSSALPPLANQRFGPFSRMYEIYGGAFARRGGQPSKPSTGERFTERAKAALELSQDEAERQRCGHIYASHLLLALAVEPGGLASRALEDLGITSELIRDALLRNPQLTGPARDAVDTLSIDAEVKRALEAAVQQAKKMGHDYIGTEHLLLGLLANPENKAVAVVKQLNVNPDNLRTKVNELMHPTEG